MRGRGNNINVTKDKTSIQIYSLSLIMGVEAKSKPATTSERKEKKGNDSEPIVPGVPKKKSKEEPKGNTAKEKCEGDITSGLKESENEELPLPAEEIKKEEDKGEAGEKMENESEVSTTWIMRLGNKDIDEAERRVSDYYSGVIKRLEDDEERSEATNKLMIYEYVLEMARGLELVQHEKKYFEEERREGT